METAARKVFECYDVDGDGLVTADEYRKVAVLGSHESLTSTAPHVAKLPA